MRVLLACSSYPPVLGGLQTVVHTLAQHLSRHGHAVRVVTHRYPRALPAREVMDGVLVQRWPFLTPNMAHLRGRRLDLFLASLVCFPYTLSRLVGLMHAFRPDVVNVHFPEHQIPFVLWLRRRFPFRLVVSLHGDEVERWFAGRPCAGLHRLRAILREADAVTACSRYLLEKAIQLEPTVAQKGHAIHNGIDPERFQDKIPYSHSRPYILAYGRLTYKKGFDMLLAAWAQVAAEYPDVDLILAGEGEERAALAQQARQLGLEGRVHFYGRARPEEVVRLLNGCRFVVVPSRLEPFGIVAVEALAAGAPLLATRVGGLPEIVGDEGDDGQWTMDDGAETMVHRPRTMLVEPTVESIAEGMRRMWHQQGKRVAPSLQEDVWRRYAWEQVAGQFERVMRGDSCEV